MSTARLALLAARPFVSAAANAGGRTQALTALKLVDQALAELKPPEKPAPSAPQGAWEPPNGWPPEDAA